VKNLYKVTIATLFLFLSALVPATAATTPPKVVFIGDWVTYYWASGFAANPNWVNQGISGVYTGNSSEALAAFQADVVSLHPAIVHIMLGADDATTTTDEGFPLAIPNFLNNLDAMVKEAKAANIKVILGIESPYFTYNPQLLDSMNSVIASYGAANNIPVINYGDALCVCVGSVSGSALSLVPNGSSFGYPIAGTGPLIVPSTYPALATGSYLAPSAAGYSVMTQMAETAIHTMNLTLKGGWLSDIQQENLNEGILTPTPNVNTVYPGAVLQFTPVGLYSDGSQQPFVNSNFQGASGTWTSSNPLVMYVNQTGQTWALSPGTAIIHYVTPSGVPFSEWIMYVLPAS
jgi:lysophospholipase L1-like esterase